MTLEQLIETLPQVAPPSKVWEGLEAYLDHEKERIAAIRAFYTALQSGEVRTELLTLNFHFSGPLGTLDLQAFQNTYTDAYAGKRIEVLDILAQQDQAAVQLRISDESTSSTSTDWIAFAGHRIQSIRSYFDASSMTNQMLG